MRSLCLVRLPVFAVLAAGPALAQTAVRDSIPMNLDVFTFYNVEGEYTNCGAGVYATWPDVLGDILGRPGTYSDYGRVATDGMYVPYGYGQFPANQLPAGVLGHNPQIGGAISGPTYLGGYAEHCAGLVSGAQTTIGGAWTYLNAQPFRITTWYATFFVPDGTPIALFAWEPTGATGIAFDASFESDQSHEVDASAPGRKRRPVASYAWDFGDGRTGSGATPTHAYDEPGDYEVTLTVTDDDGDTDDHTAIVTVEAAHLTVRVEPVTAEAQEGDEIEVVATVTNSGTEAVYGVRAERVFTYTVEYPEEWNVRGNRTNAPALEPVELAPGEDDNVYRSRMAPGESFEVRRTYRVETIGGVQIGTYAAPLTAIDTYVRWTSVDVTGETAEIPRVEVRTPCTKGGCDNLTTVSPTEYDIDVEFRVDGLVTFEAHSGLKYNPALDAIAPNIDPVEPFSFTGDASDWGDRVCSTACADVHVTVRDDEGEPAAGRTIRLSASAIPETASVTPDHTGGHFCTSATVGWTCEPMLDVETDDDGRIEAYYSFPGLIEATEAQITAELRGEPSESGTTTETLRLLPTSRTDFRQSITISAADSTLLTAARGAELGGAFFDLAGGTCASLVEGLLRTPLRATARPGSAPVLYRGANLLTQWTCSLVPTHATAGSAQKMAQTALIGWFQTAFLAPDAGLGVLDGPYPPPVVLFYDGDYFDAVLRTFGPTTPALVEGTRMELSLHEVSWLQPETLTDPIPWVEAVHFRVQITPPGGETTTIDALIEDGYDATSWLTPPLHERLAAIAEAEAERIELQQTVERFQNGDFLWIDLGGPQEELVQVRDAPTEGRLAGDVLLLTRPLRFSHPADAEVVVLRGDGPATPPAAPIAVSADTTSSSEDLTLRWDVGTFETPETFAVQATRDTLSSDLLADDTGLTDMHLGVGPATDGDVVYWRVRATNRVGEGAWSAWSTLVVDDAVAVATEAPVAHEVSLGAPFPNPAPTPSVTIPLALPDGETVRLAVYDALGRQVAVLHDGPIGGGVHAFGLVTGRLAPGVYVVRLETAGEVRAQRLTVVR